MKKMKKMIIRIDVVVKVGDDKEVGNRIKMIEKIQKVVESFEMYEDIGFEYLDYFDE